MHHKYQSAAIVLHRAPHGEGNVTVTLLTHDFGTIYARAQGARKPGAKMALGLQTLAESEVTLLKGKDGWRLAGSIAKTLWAQRLPKNARTRAARVASLADRLVRGESGDPILYSIMRTYFEALEQLPEAHHEAAEALAALRVLNILGLDAGESFGTSDDYTEPTLERATNERTALIARINRGITASGL